MRGPMGVGQQDRLLTEELALDSGHGLGAAGEFGKRDRQAVGFERDRREVVGEQACSRNRLANVSGDLLSGFHQFRRGRFESANERLAQQLKRSQVLTQAVMQVAANAPLFAFTDFKNLLLEL